MSAPHDSQAIADAVSELDPNRILELNTSRSPDAVETLGVALARALRPYQPTALVTWNSTDNGVLAHVVARELHVAVVAAYEDLGLLSLDRDLPSEGVVAVIAGMWRTPRELSALRELVRNQGATVAVAAAVIDTESLRTTEATGLPTIALVDSQPTPSSGPQS
jgi:adenine/guanine phosphoribosyltransferase-like PRPP-binding protein